MSAGALSPAQLDAYCQRIGYDRRRVADVARLQAIHALHCAAFPFENIDVQLGLQPSLDPEAIFAKLVTSRRGGWCYEINGLLGRALAAFGFHVERVCAGVVRDPTGIAQAGSHLALIVGLQETWLVDAGFGSWIGSPLPLQTGTWPQVPGPVALERPNAGTWRLSVALANRTMAYEFAESPADEALMAELCVWQASDPASVFVQNLVVQRRAAGHDLALRGRELAQNSGEHTQQRVLASADDLVATLREQFDLNVPQVAALWPAIVARHDTLFADQPAAPTT